MAKAPLLNLGDALLQGAKEPSSAPAVPIMPTSEMPMVLTLDEMAPNPDNPRTTRNPKYDEIKESIRARGLDTVPKMTKNPDIPGSPYIFSDGGNTRYAILRELYEETRDEHFYRFHVLFKPWPGRLKCLLGHLAENDVRGDLTFIDRALGVRKARTIHEETLGRVVTLRELSELLKLEGYPIHNSMISRMEHTVEFLYPYMPGLLTSGLGKHQVEQLLSLRACIEKVWKLHSTEIESESDVNSVFGEVCRQFDDPDLYSFEMFRDELIGSLIKALPHPSLNYERWLIELDPKVQNQRLLFGEPEPVAPHLVDADRQAWQNASASLSGAENDDNQQSNSSSDSTLISTSNNGAVLTQQPDSDNDDDGAGGWFGSSESSRPPKTEVQNDFLGGPSVISGDIPPGESTFTGIDYLQYQLPVLFSCHSLKQIIHNHFVALSSLDITLFFTVIGFRISFPFQGNNLLHRQLNAPLSSVLSVIRSIRLSTSVNNLLSISSIQYNTASIRSSMATINPSTSNQR